MIPRRQGPIIITVPGVSGVSVPAVTTNATVKYRWPQRYRLAAWTLLPRSGAPADLGFLSIRMQDAGGDELVTDGQGFLPGSAFLPALGVAGFQPSILKFGAGTVGAWTPRWQNLEVAVKAGDQWIFQVASSKPAGAIVPDLLFLLAEHQ
jgi:hypothetical protein